MNPGDTVIVALRDTSVDSHLWIVISDTVVAPDRVVIVNMTSWRSDKDQACVLEVGDHSYVTHRTCINYADAKIQTTANLETLIAKGMVQRHATCSEELLVRIRDGVNESRMKMHIVEELVAQGVIDEL